jgi:hypothetical protein
MNQFQLRNGANWIKDALRQKIGREILKNKQIINCFCVNNQKLDPKGTKTFWSQEDKLSSKRVLLTYAGEETTLTVLTAC